MTGSDCTATRERAAEFALGILDGSDRDELLVHLSGCARCQSVVDELIEVADGLPHLAPEAEPPTGFQHAVLAAMRPTRRRSACKGVAVLAATAAAVAISSLAVVRVIDAGRDVGRTTASPALRTIAMTGVDGQVVGMMTVSRGDPAALAISVDYAVPDGRYAVELQTKGGARSPIATLTVTGGKGAWTGPAVLPAHNTATVALLDQSGVVVCHADITA